MYNEGKLIVEFFFSYGLGEQKRQEYEQPATVFMQYRQKLAIANSLTAAAPW